MSETTRAVSDTDHQHREHLLERLILPLLLLGGALIRLALAWRDLEVLDTLFFPDDTYLSLGVARNLALGLGSTFDGQISTNGYQPLYVWLMVPVYLLFPDDLTTPVHIAVTLLGLASVLTGWLIFRIVRRLAGAWHAALACAIWMFDPLVLRHGLNGLETGLALLGIAATTDWYLAHIRGRAELAWRHLLGLGVLAGLTILTRVDQAVLLAAIGLDMLLDHRSRRTLGQLLVVGAVALLVNLPWLAFSLSIGSGLMPESGAAVRFNAVGQMYDWSRRLAALVVWLSVLFTGPYSTFLLLIGGMLTFIVRRFTRKGNHWLARWKERARPLRFAAFYSLALPLAYLLYIPAYWFFDRYLHPIALFALLAGVLMLPDPAMLSGGPARLLARAALAFVALELGLALRLLAITPAPDGYLGIARWANEQLAGQTVGAFQSGAIGYWGRQIRVVNLDGVVDREALRARHEGRLGEEVLRRGVDWVIEWSNPPGRPSDRINELLVLREEAPGGARWTGNESIPGITSWGSSWYLFEVRE